MKRVLLSLALVGGLLASASPALGAETWHWRNSGSGAFAAWSNVAWSEDESLAPGTYFVTYVDASAFVDSGDGGWADGLCVETFTFTVDEQGEWLDDSWLAGCASAETLDVDRRLGSARVVGSVPIVECEAWTEEGECDGEPTEIGRFEVDLSFTGIGPAYRYHGASSGGTAGFYQGTYRGSGQSREATVTGTLTLDGTSAIAGATNAFAMLWTSRQGAVEVYVCRPTAGPC